jgi:hypothetical protein
MSTTFDHPDRLSVRCDARLKPLLAEVARARRQPPGGVLEVLVEAEHERLSRLGRVSSVAPAEVLPGRVDPAVEVSGSGGHCVGRRPAPEVVR